VQEAVAAEWGISPDDLVGMGRARSLVTPRRIAMLICRDVLHLSLREIGSAFGNRDNSTVLSALAKARIDASDPATADHIARIRAMLPGIAAGSRLDAPVRSGLSGGPRPVPPSPVRRRT
jgi:chromosomal replication initiator protein